MTMTLTHWHILSHSGLGDEMAVTNVQRVPFDNKFGNLSPEGIWRPAALNGIDGEQVVAVATVVDSLHLVHTSYTPFHSLLEKAMQLSLGSVLAGIRCFTAIFCPMLEMMMMTAFEDAKRSR